MKPAQHRQLTKPFISLFHASRIEDAYTSISKFLLSARNSKPFNGSLILLATAFYILRGYRYFTNPQLYAEDGGVWLSDAYNKGFKTVFEPYNGLSHLFERLFGLASVHLFPLQYEPVFYNIAALLIFILLAYYLFSPRTGLLINNYEKLFVGLSLCLIGNAEELFFSFSNSVFYLGIIGLLLVIATKSKHRVFDVLEKVLFFAICFTLVFSWVIFIILLFDWLWYHRKKYYYLICSGLGAIIEFLVHIYSKNQRPDIPTQDLLAKNTLFEFYNQIITPSLRFARLDLVPAGRTRTELLIVCLSLFLVACTGLFIFMQSNYKTRYFLFFCLAMTFISLKSPLNGLTQPVQIVAAMATYHWGNRYFIYGIIGMFIVWAKFSKQLFRPRLLLLFLVFFFAFGLLTSVQLGSFFIQRDLVNLKQQYTTDVAKHQKNPYKTTLIPINPTGWYVTLDAKH